MSNLIVLDELDKKFLAEFSLVVDVFVTTLSKIQTLLSNQFQIVEGILARHMSAKENWAFSNRNPVKDLHRPFMYPDYESNPNKYKITKLEPHYDIGYEKKILKGSEDQTVNFFWCKIGFWYDQNEYNGKPLVYYLIAKWDCDKYGGYNIPLSYYEDIKENSSMNIEIEHPDLNKKNEFIQIYCNEFTTETINNTFDFYLNEMLRPYLAKLKW